MDIIYHSMSTTWKNKMIEQGFNFAGSTIKEMTEARVENMEPKEDRKNLQQLLRNPRRTTRKGNKRTLAGSGVVESSEETLVESCPNKKYCILYGNYSYSTENARIYVLW